MDSIVCWQVLLIAFSASPWEAQLACCVPNCLCHKLYCRPCLHNCLRRPAALNFALARGPDHKAKTKSAFSCAIPAAPLPNTLHMTGLRHARSEDEIGKRA